jgi:cytosine permease
MNDKANAGRQPHQTQDSAKEAYNNDNATVRVPEKDYKSTFDIAMVCCGFCICMSGLFTGAAMAGGLSLKEAIFASIIGNLILSLYSGAIGYAGAKEHVATSMLARYSFGRQGSYVISLALALTMLGWYSVQVGFFGDTIHAMLPNAGFITKPPVAAFWGGILMLVTAYVGYKGLSLLSMVAVPLIVIVAVVGVAAAVNSTGGWAQVLAIEPAKPLSIGTAIVMVVGSFAAGGSAQPDITRYAKTPKAALQGTFIGYFMANMFIILAGFITCLATGNGDLPSAMLRLGLGVPALLVLVAAQWTTNDNNLYTASLGLSNILRVKKSYLVLVSGVLATIVGAAGLANYFVDWLIVLGTTMPPMAGIIVADYFLLSKQKYEYGPGTKYCAWNVLAFISWIVAAFVGYFVSWGVAAINSMLVGFALYFVFMRTLGRYKVGILGVVVED